MANNFVANAGFLKVYWSLGGQLAINVYGVRVPAGVTITQALADTVGAAVKAGYTANLAPLQPAANAVIRVGLRDFRTPNQPEFRDSGGIAAGTAPTADALPRGVALCVTLRTGLAGKSFRGRTYLPGFNETQNDGSATTVSAASAAAVTYVTSIKNALEASAMFLAVLSRPTDRTVLTRTIFHPDGTTTTDTLSDESARVGGVTDVTTIEARNNTWEYQRRRDNSRGGSAPALAMFTPAAIAQF